MGRNELPFEVDCFIPLSPKTETLVVAVDPPKTEPAGRSKVEAEVVAVTTPPKTEDGFAELGVPSKGELGTEAEVDPLTSAKKK